MVSVINAGHGRNKMENLIQKQVTELLGNYGWMFIVGAAILLFRRTIENAVDGFIIFFGNDYNEDDVVEINGKPGRIIRVGIWKTVFFTYDVRGDKVVGGSKLVVTNSKLKDLKIEKPLPLLDLTKYKVDTKCSSCPELLDGLIELKKCNKK
tara:strand:+ start:40 stop:495 length:456 start_codon:yes stop_codon:yes gene_type:complete